jgi:type IV secretion system protein VirD4
VTTSGSACWAEARDIKHAGLLHPDGVLLGRWRGAYLRHHGPEDVLCFAPTRSTKGVCYRDVLAAASPSLNGR